MSYYPGLVSKNEGFRSYLVQVNQYGEMVMYTLDAEGRTTGTTTGDAVATFRLLLKEISPPVRIWDMRSRVSLYSNRDTPGFWGFFERTWGDVLRVMGGKGKRAGEFIEKYGTLLAIFGIDFIEDPRWKSRSLTDRGKEADAKIMAEIDARASEEESDDES